MFTYLGGLLGFCTNSGLDISRYCRRVPPLEAYEENAMETAMLRWTAEVTRLDHIRNEVIRERFGVAPIVDRLLEVRLRYYDHVLRANNDSVCKIGLNLGVHGKEISVSDRESMSYKFRCDLIALVEQEKALWDTSTDEYRIAERKNAAWIKIVDQLRAKGFNYNVYEAKKAWKNLRDQWRKKLKVASAKAEPNCCDPQWTFMKHMKFLESCELMGEKRRWSSSTDPGSSRTSTPSTAVDEGEYPVPNHRTPDGEHVSKMKKTVVVKQEADDTSACESTKEENAHSTEEIPQERDKFAAFGSFVGSYLRDMPNDEAIQKMNIISQALFQQVVLVDQQYN